MTATQVLNKTAQAPSGGAGILDQLVSGGSRLVNQAASGGSNLINQLGNSDMVSKLKGIWSGLPEDQKTMVIRGLIGGGAGAGALGLSRMFSGGDEDDNRPGVMGQVLLGLLLGGTAGAASTMIPKGLLQNFTPPPPSADDASGPGAMAAVGRNAGAPAGMLAYRRLIHRNQPGYEGAASRTMNTLRTGKLVDDVTAKRFNTAHDNYKHRSQVKPGKGGSTRRGMFDTTLNRSNTLAALNESDVFKRIMQSDAMNKTKPGQWLKQHMPETNNSTAKFHRAMQKVSPDLHRMTKPKLFGRSRHVAGYLGSALVADWLTRKAFNAAGGISNAIYNKD